MPVEDCLDPTKVDVAAEQLARSSAAALDATHELLAHYADTGDAATQRAVDTLIDHAADALRLLTDSLADSSRGLRAAAARTTAPFGTDGVSTRVSRRRDLHR